MEILMFDGSKKQIHNIVIGDLIMADNSTSRKILNIYEGEDELYKLIPTKGDPFIINGSQVIAFKYTSQGTICHKKTGQFNVTYFDGKVERNAGFDTFEKAQILSSTVIDLTFNMQLNEFFKMTKTVKHKLKLFSIPVTYTPQNVTVDPYFLGLWIGDGCKRNTLITTMDVEIVTYLEKFATDSGLGITIHDQQDNKSKHYNLRGIKDGNKRSKNYLLKEMKKLNVINNKHIPSNYKFNSRNVQLQVLAGLIDSDGYYYKSNYEIIQKREIIARDIVEICHSLGYACSIRVCTKGCVYKGEYRPGIYYRVTFYGKDMHDIPVLLARKKFTSRLQIKDPLVAGFKIEAQGIGKYYKFDIDGDQRFLLGNHVTMHT